MAAAASQYDLLVSEALAAREAERVAAWHRRRASNCVKGAAGELRVCRELSRLAPYGYHHLDDRVVVDGKAANIDHLVVGPTGVFIVDAKNWSGRVEVRAGSLFQNGKRRDCSLLALAWIGGRVDEFLTMTSAPLLTARCVASLPTLASAAACGRIEITTDDQLAELISSGPRVLSGEQVEEIVELLAGVFAPYDVDERDVARAQEFLFPELETRHAGLRAALERPVEDWMIWLHPEQARLVRSSYGGPMRIRGAAGTGKTVVGLHRAAYLARTRPGRLLVTSYVRTLSDVYATLFRRLAPAVAERVDFFGLHQLALQILRGRGHTPVLNSSGAKTAFNLAWLRYGHDLAGKPLTRDYFQQEIECVIKGRALSSCEEYLTLDRRGRRARLSATDRQAVWQLYEEYERQLRRRGLVDFIDLLRLCRDELQREPLAPAYSSVIVDEVQDLPLVGVQLCHALGGGDRPDGLMLIGDGQQSLYPGSYTLADAGIPVTGRSVVLQTNYRNTVEILAAAAGVVCDDEFDDLDAAVSNGRRHVAVVRHGEAPATAYAPTVAQHDQHLVARLNELLSSGIRPDDIAILLPTNDLVRQYERLLRETSINFVRLRDWDGTARGLKIGTCQRAKGLEFGHVLAPRADAHTDAAATCGSEAVGERSELARRALFVAMTRARDSLWIGQVLIPTH